MRNLAFICSALLIILGCAGYFGWESIGASKQSVTALIPAFVGIPTLIGALIAMKNNMLGMHISVTFTLLGALAGLGRLIPSAIKGNLDWSTPAPKMITAMTVICAFFTVMAVRSFIAARKAREAGDTPAAPEE
ncbi:MAG: hypothetical protein CMO80_13355 [Verrucomicrobiales bacterium]|nr:hypothetical protein [Verrucomicrobiales bacterium]|tara:strand:- start:4569 stop:4970 length:402 start_codon:yes stop_codon:yes gene_type:complete